MYWYEFKFAACDFATCDFATMHKDCFCGEAGPRSIFTIHAIHAYLIQPFSHFPEEAEVIFCPTSRFVVTWSQKRLRPLDLALTSKKGVFPDEIHLQQVGDSDSDSDDDEPEPEPHIEHPAPLKLDVLNIAPIFDQVANASLLPTGPEWERVCSQIHDNSARQRNWTPLDH